MIDPAADNPSEERDDHSLGLPNVELIPSGDFARLALGEIEPEQYGRVARLSERDRLLNALIRQWRRELRMRELRRRRRTIVRQTLFQGLAWPLGWFIVSTAVLLPAYLTAPRQLAIAGSVIMPVLAVLLVHIGYRRRRERFLSGEEPLSLPAGAKSGT